MGGAGMQALLFLIQLSGGGDGAVRARPKTRNEFGSRMSVLLSNPDYLLEGFAEKKCHVNL